MAVVFELRHFSRYYPVSQRILRNLKKDWESRSDRAEHWQDLLSEIDLAIEFFEKQT